MELIEKTLGERFEGALARIFPAKMGHVKTVDDSLRRIMIEDGLIPVYGSEHFQEVPYKVWEWNKTRWERVK
jgi:hypothetical protein